MGTKEGRMGLLLLSLFCGWVLWHYKDLGSPSKGYWRIDAAYEQWLECRTDRRESREAFLKSRWADNTERELRGDQMVIWFLKDSKRVGSMVEELSCLPAGTDPRPRFKE